MGRCASRKQPGQPPSQVFRTCAMMGLHLARLHFTGSGGLWGRGDETAGCEFLASYVGKGALDQGHCGSV
eukprot:3810490-Amphidinium_carterae.1